MLAGEHAREPSTCSLAAPPTEPRDQGADLMHAAGHGVRARHTRRCGTFDSLLEQHPISRRDRHRVFIHPLTEVEQLRYAAAGSSTRHRARIVGPTRCAHLFYVGVSAVAHAHLDSQQHQPYATPPFGRRHLLTGAGPITIVDPLRDDDAHLGVVRAVIGRTVHRAGPVRLNVTDLTRYGVAPTAGHHSRWAPPPRAARCRAPAVSAADAVPAARDRPRPGGRRPWPAGASRGRAAAGR